MKAFTTIALAAAASAAPEAHHHFLGQQPLVYSHGGMVHHSNGAVVPDDTFAVKAAKVDHLTAKAKTYLSKPLVGLVHSLAASPVAQTIASPVVSSYSGLYNPYMYNTHLIKREAEAEADSQVLLNTPYTGYNTMYNGVYNGVFNYPKPAVTYTAGAVTPMVNSAISAPHYSGLYNYGIYGNTHHMIAKREAEAEADSQVLLNTPYTGYNTMYNGVYNGVFNFPKAAVTYTAGTVNPMVVNSAVSAPHYSGLYNYGPYGNTHHMIAKREAEADSQVLFNTPYTGYNAMYNGAYNGVFNYPKAAVTYTTGAVTPMVVNSAVSAPIYSGLNGYGLYGNTHSLIVKREAEAEPQFMFRAPYTTHPINYQQPIYRYMSPMMTPFIGAHHLF